MKVISKLSKAIIKEYEDVKIKEGPQKTVIFITLDNKKDADSINEFRSLLKKGE